MISCSDFDNYFLFSSYAREWQAKLKELRDNKALAVSAAAALLSCPSVTASANTGSKRIPSPITSTPLVSITPSYTKKSNGLKSPPRGGKQSPIKMDSSGALNLASPSPAPSDLTTTSSPSMPDTSVSSRSPTGFVPSGRASGQFGVEICVVCGDRASGE